jgi:glycine betaine/proline transport system substrate-binding protein
MPISLTPANILRLCLLFLLTAVAACTTTPANQPAPVTKQIKIAESPWSASALNALIAKTVLEQELGYTVEIVPIDEISQWEALAKGDLHASLEVWPSGHAANIQKYIQEQGTVENGGLLGAVGRIGWYVPTYVVEDHPELAIWESYRNPELTALFRTANSGNKGQFLGGDETWTQHDADIIRNLKLELEVIYAGSEETLLAAVDQAYTQQEPLLFYFWTPHAVHARYNLTPVILPAYSDACYAKAESGGIDCSYAPDLLFKIFWSGLKSYAPEAHHFLSKFLLSTEDQIELLGLVEVQGKSHQEAAQIWIDKNSEKWRSWLPAQP